ncbi:MAG: 2-oxo acid dehydrogenase subunit E2 [Candidatus Hydrogenedentes bacterium]|nr:2-oxo acid dehydrogenase subunit E2 [Candidatus Hydrogenedentota bacterium]
MFQDFRVAYLRKHVKVRDAQRFSFLRQMVAYFLSESARKTPHAAMTVTYDVTPVVEYGQAKESEIAEASAKMDEKALFRRAIHKNFSAFFLKAVAHGLHHTPCMNGFIDYAPFLNGGTFYRAEDINLSFTAHTKYGVVRPVLRNPHLKPLEQVASEMRDLVRRARRTDPEQLYFEAASIYALEGIKQLDLKALGALWITLRGKLWQRPVPEPGYEKIPEKDKLKVDDILGATCTVANIGMMIAGTQTVTVIVPPEVMMFGIGDLKLAPWVVGGQVVPRYTITVMGAMDHRAFDAGEAFPFGKHLKRYFDHPELIFEWKEGDPL